MSVILVLLMFAIFLTIDYLRERKHAPKTAVQAEPKALAPPRIQPSFVSGFQVPENLRYHPGHTWALQESPALVRVGMDDFAARLIGTCEEVLLPKRGQWIRQGQKLATIIRGGKKAELVSPIEGEVTRVNDAVGTDASLPCRDPYGEGWLITVMSPDAPTSFRNLLGGLLARSWMAEAANRLRAWIPAMAGAVAQDGGVAVNDLAAQVPNETWSQLTHEFLLL